MEFLVFAALVTLIIFVVKIRQSQQDLSQQLNNEFAAQRREISRLTELINNQHQPQPSATQTQQAAAALQKEKEEQKLAILEALRLQKEEKKKAAAMVAAASVVPPVTAGTPPPTTAAAPPPGKPAPGWYETWLGNNPDLEKFIGENLFNKIGIAVLVVGIAFFVKYAIDKNWINEYGRVGIGLLCGIILTGLAHYLRKTYRSFSSVLAGGGLAVFYFTITLAFRQYHIIGQTPAFLMMIAITVFAVLLSLLYDKLELAVIAAVGGFLSPFFVSTGDGNYVVLFSYLIILNMGLLTLSYFKKWRLINILSLFFTLLIYGGWLVDHFLFENDSRPHLNALLFGTCFYLLFLAMAMIYNLRKQIDFKPFDYFILLFINLGYYLAGLLILSQWQQGDYKGLFTIGLGLINLALALYFFTAKKAGKTLLYLLIGLTLSYFSLTAPVQLHGRSITLFWAAETVLLFWLYQRSRISVFKIASVIIIMLMGVSLLLDWNQASHQPGYQLPVIFTGTGGIITNCTVIAAISLYAFLLRKENASGDFLFGLKNKTLQGAFGIAAALLLFITVYFGINLYFSSAADYTLPNIYQRICYSLVIWVIVQLKTEERIFLWLKILLSLSAFIFFFGSGGLIMDLRTAVVEGNYSFWHQCMHWCSDILLLLVLYRAICLVQKNSALFKTSLVFFTWVAALMLVYFFSFEIMQWYRLALKDIAAQDILQEQFNKAGLTILWGICSLVMMWLGMSRKYKPLRIISLSLFAAALFKLFLFDIRDISPGGKIAAFIMLGILLLTVSFMYQRLKKLLLDDKEQ